MRALIGLCLQALVNADVAESALKGVKNAISGTSAFFQNARNAFIAEDHSAALKNINNYNVDLRSTRKNNGVHQAHIDAYDQKVRSVSAIVALSLDG